MTAVADLSGPQLALYDEAWQSADPASFLRTAFDWSVTDRRAVAEALDDEDSGYVEFGIPPTSKVRLPETVQKLRKHHPGRSR